LNKVGSRAYATGNPCSGRIYQFDFISFLPDSSVVLVAFLFNSPITNSEVSSSEVT
jgi:hypothetical protein